MFARLRQSLHRFSSLFRNRQMDEDLRAEMAAHLALAIEENLRRGLSV
jgi:hypothetical protein